VRLAELSPEQVCAWRLSVPEGHRFEATQALRQVLNRAVACAAVPKPQHAVPWQPVTCELHAASIASPQPRPAASQSIACDCADGLTMFAAERALDAGWTGEEPAR
jgi:hypothetical protein